MKNILTYRNIIILLGLFVVTTQFQKCTLEKNYVNTVGMKMIYIPVGSCMMGDSSGQWDEKPVHKVTITRPFYISVTEIKARQFQGYKKDFPIAKEKYAMGVSWYEANGFYKWLDPEGKLISKVIFLNDSIFNKEIKDSDEKKIFI